MLIKLFKGLELNPLEELAIGKVALQISKILVFDKHTTLTKIYRITATLIRVKHILHLLLTTLRKWSEHFFHTDCIAENSKFPQFSYCFM